MPIPVSHSASRGPADSALARALRQDGAARREQLAALGHRYPDHGPTWLALAEEHLSQRRVEEARDAARRALRIDASLARHFSRALARECASIMPPDHPASRHPGALSHEAQRAQEMRDRIHSQGDADVELAQAKSLHGLARSDRMQELTRRFPTHAPTWLALAEEYLAQRRVEKAMDAYQRALALDPGQAHFASPKLETAHRYCDREAAPRHRLASSPRPAPSPRPEPSYGRETLRRLQSRAGSSVQVPRSSPDERTRYLPYSQIKRPEAKTIPPYLRTPSGSHRPAQVPSRRLDTSYNVGQELERVLELPTAAQRLQALRELEKIAPVHAGVLFHLAVQAVMVGSLDEARNAGHTLSRVDPRRYRQLYEWADEWAQSARYEEPVHEPMVERPVERAHHEVAASARTLCLELPRPQTPPSAPMRPVEGQGYKTQLLPVPAAILAQGSSPVSAPASHEARSLSNHAQAPSRSTFGRRLRTAGALVAGVAAGLLVAMLLVFVVTSAGSLESQGDEERARPTLVKEQPDPDRETTPTERAMLRGTWNDDTSSAGDSASGRR